MFLRPPPFFINEPATSAIYTLSLHDALPILRERFQALALAAWWQLIQPTVVSSSSHHRAAVGHSALTTYRHFCQSDRKSTRLNSSHSSISYAVFCLKKKRLRAEDFQLFARYD